METWTLIILSVVAFINTSNCYERPSIERQEYPFLASIYNRIVATYTSKLLDYERYFVCSGAILNKFWIMTSADCMVMTHGWDVVERDVKMNVIVGKDQDIRGHTGNMRRVESIYIHPQYRNSTGENNIALLRLLAPLTIDIDVQPVSLSSDIIEINRNYLEDSFKTCILLSGPFFSTRVLPVIDVSYCMSLHHNKHLKLDENHACTFDHKRKNYACGSYLGGGLLVCGPKEYNKVYGILHYSASYQKIYPPCKKPPKNPEVYTKVAAYTSWISDTIGHACTACNKKRVKKVKKVKKARRCRRSVKARKIK